MKRTIPILGLALTIVGLLQPITNIPKSPEVSAETNHAIVKTVKPENVPPAPQQQAEASPSPTPAPQPAPAPPAAAVSDSEADAKAWIYNTESGNNPDSINSIGCRGIGQACPGGKLPCGDSYVCQDSYFTSYMQERYGSWAAAKAFHLQNGWW